MALYDIESEYKKGKFTYSSLCQELMAEYEVRTGDVAPGEEYFRDKIKNSKNSGIINKLNKLLGTDVEEMVVATESDEERFKLLKLIKLLYYIEKDGTAKSDKCSDGNVRILITDVLQKPRLENVKTEYSEKSVYGEYFEELFAKVKSQVPDADERIKKIENMNAYWEYITNMVFDYVITDKALDKPDDALKELNRILTFLEKRVLARLDTKTPPITYEKGILENFFILLVCHRIMCADRDRLNINYRICEAREPERKYIDLYRDREGYEISRENIKILEDYICSETDTEKIKEIMYLILWGLDKKYYDQKACEFAIKNYETLLNWWVSDKDIDVSKSVAIDTFISIMQELIVVYKDKEGFKNDYYGYNNPNRSLTASVKNPQMADAVAVQAWIKKLENRAVANLGALKLIKKKRDIENIIYEIKGYIFSFHNIDDMAFVNSQIYYIAARSMISQNFAMDIGNEFAKTVCKHLSSKIHDINVILPTEGINVYNMFKDFTVDKSGALERVAYELATIINDFYDEKSNVVTRGYKINVTISWSELSKRNSMMTLTVDRTNGNVIYKQYVGVESDANCDRMRRLGLGEFIVDGNPEIRFF